MSGSSPSSLAPGSGWVKPDPDFRWGCLDCKCDGKSIPGARNHSKDSGHRVQGIFIPKGQEKSTFTPTEGS